MFEVSSQVFCWQKPLGFFCLALFGGLWQLAGDSRKHHVTVVCSSKDLRCWRWSLSLLVPPCLTVVCSFWLSTMYIGFVPEKWCVCKEIPNSGEKSVSLKVQWAGLEIWGGCFCLISYFVLVFNICCLFKQRVFWSGNTGWFKWVMLPYKIKGGGAGKKEYGKLSLDESFPLSLFFLKVLVTEVLTREQKNVNIFAVESGEG